MTTSQQTPKTQADIIKAHLMTGRSIDIWQSIHEYHITALSQRIGNLKRKGLPVKSVMVKENGKRFARYSLDMPISNKTSTKNNEVNTHE